MTGTIDHFRPKSKYPKLAFVWSNYRLAGQAINMRKGDSEDVVDPFTVCPMVDSPSICLGDGIKPGPSYLARNTEDN